MRSLGLVGGPEVRWVERSDGFPVVLVHGVPTSPALWRHVLPRLHGARALAFEMVGYGDSIPAGRTRDISLARQADYLVAWLQAVGLERVVLAGHDLGGGVAQIVAARHPRLCAGLLLTNCVGYDYWPVPEVRLLQAMGPVVARMPDLFLRLVLRVLMARGHEDHERAAESFEVHCEPYLRHDGATALVRQLRALDARDTMSVADRLPRLDIPVTVLWGTSDPFLDVRHGERLARGLGTRLRPIEGASHFTPEDRPGEIADALNELVLRVAASG